MILVTANIVFAATEKKMEIPVIPEALKPGDTL